MNLEIPQPTLVVNKNRCLKNIYKMSEKAKNHNLLFRPHFKTHQSAEIGKWYKQFGISGITVSSLEMAEYFANAGFDNITVAIPFNPNLSEKAETLSTQIKLTLLIENLYTAQTIVSSKELTCDFVIEIDTGYNRTGIEFDNHELIDNILQIIEPNRNIRFEGFLTHAGHTYETSNQEQIREIHLDCLNKLTTLKRKYITKYPELILSIGDTPSCSIMNSFNNIDEIRPGNFVFYDLMQVKLGSCQIDDIAICLSATIIAKYENRDEIVIHCGAVHLSKEYLISDGEFGIPSGKKYYGILVKLNDNGTWSTIIEDCYISNISQEHGTICVSNNKLDLFQIGDIIGILPIHSCLTKNLMQNFTIIC